MTTPQCTRTMNDQSKMRLLADVLGYFATQQTWYAISFVNYGLRSKLKTQNFTQPYYSRTICVQ